MTIAPHFSMTKRAGDLVFVSGQLPFAAPGKLVEGGIEAQTRSCMEHVKKALSDVGVPLERVVKVMVWLTDPGNFADFNKTYAEYFPESPPARATVCSALAVAGALIEIEAIAYSPE